MEDRGKKAVADTILTYIITTIIGIIIGGIISFVKMNHSRNKVMFEAIKATVSDSYFRVCRTLSNKPSISRAEYENFERLYKSYRGLGMNGEGEKLYEQIHNKPLKLDS